MIECGHNIDTLKMNKMSLPFQQKRLLQEYSHDFSANKNVLDQNRQTSHSQAALVVQDKLHMKRDQSLNSHVLPHSHQFGGGGEKAEHFVQEVEENQIF